MYVIHATSVDGALAAGLRLLEERGELEQSRAGPVMVMPEPVTTVWWPWLLRVSLCPVRDANPFFHMVEAAWMLSGDRYSRLLDEFVHDFSSRFAEVSGEQHGAYGHRWRHAFGIDQLDACVGMLRRDPTSRRAVLQMWDCTHGQCDDLGGEFRDHPCNTHAYLRVRTGDHAPPVLDLTVCCRSNDIIWGAYGANVVHFSILHEYMAARIGVGVGTYRQVSHNFHAYVSGVDRLRSRASDMGLAAGQWPIVGDGGYDPRPLVDHPPSFDRELELVMLVIAGQRAPSSIDGVQNRWLRDTLFQAVVAFRAYRARSTRQAVLDAASLVHSPDWRVACMSWLERRMARWQ